MIKTEFRVGLKMKKFYFLISFILCLFLAACSKKESEIATEQNAQVSADEKLGTKWGDEVTSHVTEVNLKRLSDQPIAESQVRYANKQYQGKTVNSISLAAGKISFSIVDDADAVLPLFREGQSYYLAGQDGQSYQLKYENHTDSTFEVVASVDGIDVLDGSTVICAELAGDFHLGYARQLTDKSSLLFDLAF